MKRVASVYTPMGITAENVAKKFEIARADQDAFAASSHQKAAAAKAAGRFADEIVAVQAVKFVGQERKTYAFTDDELVRADTTPESLGGLKPVFSATGSVTAGNASPLSDGAAAMIVASKAKADQIGAKPLGYFRSFATIGVDDAVGVALQLHQLIFFQRNDFPGVGQKGRDVAGQQVFAGSNADHERRRLSYGYDRLRLSVRNDHQRVSAAESLHRNPNGFQERATLFVLNSNDVSRDFGVGLAEKGVALSDQFFPKFKVILDDAVVQDRNRPVLVKVRMGVFIGGTAVGGPTGVTNGATTLHRMRV
jgi:hypothetical protein